MRKRLKPRHKWFACWVASCFLQCVATMPLDWHHFFVAFIAFNLAVHATIKWPPV